MHKHQIPFGEKRQMQKENIYKFAEDDTWNYLHDSWIENDLLNKSRTVLTIKEKNDRFN